MERAAHEWKRARGLCKEYLGAPAQQILINLCKSFSLIAEMEDTEFKDLASSIAEGFDAVNKPGNIKGARKLCECAEAVASGRLGTYDMQRLMKSHGKEAVDAHLGTHPFFLQRLQRLADPPPLSEL